MRKHPDEGVLAVEDSLEFLSTVAHVDRQPVFPHDAMFFKLQRRWLLAGSLELDPEDTPVTSEDVVGG